MSISSLEQVTQAIIESDERHNPGSLFSHVPEENIWIYATTILDDPESSYLLAPTLLQGIGEAMPFLSNHSAASSILLHALQYSHESLVYQQAQHVVLQYAKTWEKPAVRRFFGIFEEGYLEVKDGGNQFLARLALEGAVLLPIFREENALLHKAIGLLLEDFPAIPGHPSATADLVVKAIQLLGQCYDQYPHDKAIVAKIRECRGSANYTVAAEASFVTGIIALYEAFQSSNETDCLEALIQAELHFHNAYTSTENRSDAELFSTVTKCYVLFFQSAPASLIIDTIHQAQHILTERILLFGNGEQSQTAEDEFRLVQLLLQLERWATTLADITQWPDLKLSLQILADAYAAVRTTTATSHFMEQIERQTQHMIMLPYVSGKFLQIQEIIAKLTRILSDTEWRQRSSVSEREFCELLLQTLRDVSSPKERAATELEKLRVAAEHTNPALAASLAQIQKSEKMISDGVVELARQYLHHQPLPATELPVNEGPAKEICQRLLAELKEKLGWDTSTKLWIYLSYAIRLTVFYLIRLYRTTPGEAAPTDVSFLFAEGIRNLKGKGQRAVEQDLESHFYNTMYIANELGAIERQSQSIAPGRPDLNFRFGDIIFPIEIKREFSDISQEHIYKSYIAQPQSYAAALHGISFLFLLDLTPKPLGTPLRNVVDYCSIEHRPATQATQKDYVIVVIFPANRPRPSDHSWS